MLIEATTSTPARLVLEGELPGVAPERVTEAVLITTTRTDDGTHVTLTHSDYGPDDQNEIRDHAETWQLSFDRLVSALA